MGGDLQSIGSIFGYGDDGTNKSSGNSGCDCDIVIVVFFLIVTDWYIVVSLCGQSHDNIVGNLVVHHRIMLVHPMHIGIGRVVFELGEGLCEWILVRHLMKNVISTKQIQSGLWQHGGNGIF